MATNRDDKYLGQIGRLFDGGTVAGLAEGQILERFVVHRDGAAFQALVTRYGSTVLGVCRRFLRDPNDVEDAFQATFIILARKAGGLRDREALGPWLYGVAYRVASRARADAARRRRREALDDEAIARASGPEPGRPELRWLLDEEISRLPHKLRLPVVLCLMEGQTYDEAAHQLRWTSSMVRGRLAEARAKLRERLIRRGEVPSAALAWIEIEAPPVPPGLVDSALKMASDAISGTAATSSAVALANRMMRSWLMARIGTAALVLIAAGVALDVGSTGLRLVAQDGDRARIAPAQADAPANEKPIAKPSTVSAPKRVQGPVDSEIHPVTIEGRALDRDGRPVNGASILVTNANRTWSGDKVLGRGVSGLDGRFLIRNLPLPVLQPDPSPIPKPAEGKFEVAGWVPGLAFTWHRIQSYRPSPRPADFKGTGPGLEIFTGEPILADLVFGPPARIHGRIIDNQGQPVGDAKVQVGYIDDPRRPHGSGIWNCQLISPDGGDGVGGFNGIGSLPESLRSARTDAEGRYVIDGLPREAQLLTLIDQAAALEPYSTTIATSTAKFKGVRSLGYDGELDHTFVRPGTVRVRVNFADSGRPAPRVRVLAQGEKTPRAGAVGTTDAEGRMSLALPPGTYTLRAEPPFGMPYLLTEQPFEVKGDTRESSVDLAVSPAAVVVLEAVDADSGEALSGAGFEFVTDTSADRHALHSQTVFVDHPTTDRSGKLRAVMAPGRRQFLVGQAPRGYEPSTKSSPMLTLGARETATLLFEFKKQALAAKIREAEEDQAGQRLRTLWQAQSQQIGRGRMRARRVGQLGDSMSCDRLRQLLESLDPDKLPPLLDLIQRTFPEAKPAHGLTMDIIVDEPRRRQDGVWEKGQPHQAPDVLVYNGNETVRYSGVNAQVDIHDDGPKSGIRMAVAGLGDFCHWPDSGGKVVGRADGRVTLERKSGASVTRIVADEATGFVYREANIQANEGPVREIWQFAPRSTAKEAIVPGLSIEYVHQKDRTYIVWIKTIESIDLDTPIPPDTFVVSVPAGVVFLDYREGRDDAYRGMAKFPVTDAVAHADADPRRHKPFAPPIKVGMPAPAIEPIAWLDRGGKIPSPSLTGKVVLVDFWGIECGPCLAQLPEVREAAEHFSGEGLIIVGLHDSSATPENLAEFAVKRGLTWPLAIDRPGEGFGATFQAYGVRSIPSAAVLDRQGHVAYLGRFPEALAKAASLLKQE